MTQTQRRMAPSIGSASLEAGGVNGAGWRRGVRIARPVMTLALTNTLRRSTQPIQPLEPGRVRMYSCGPTVYRYAHVGNLRTFLLPDLIRRVLLYHGVEVFHVQNITDVGHLRDERFDRGEDRMLV